MFRRRAKKRGLNADQPNISIHDWLLAWFQDRKARYKIPSRFGSAWCTGFAYATGGPLSRDKSYSFAICGFQTNGADRLIQQISMRMRTLLRISVEIVIISIEKPRPSVVRIGKLCS